jgi:hypothetical protein
MGTRVLEFGLKSVFRPRIYEITRDGALAAVIACSRMWERATITIDGVDYAAAREGKMSGAFYLEADGNRVASTQKPSLKGRQFTVQVGERTLTLKSASVFGRSYVLTENGVQIGVLRPLGWLSRQWQAEFPDDLAFPVQVFLVWLVIVLWRRAQVIVAATTPVNTALASG